MLCSPGPAPSADLDRELQQAQERLNRIRMERDKLREQQQHVAAAAAAAMGAGAAAVGAAGAVGPSAIPSYGGRSPTGANGYAPLLGGKVRGKEGTEGRRVGWGSVSGYAPLLGAKVRGERGAKGERGRTGAKQWAKQTGGLKGASQCLMFVSGYAPLLPLLGGKVRGEEGTEGGSQVGRGSGAGEAGRRGGKGDQKGWRSEPDGCTWLCAAAGGQGEGRGKGQSIKRVGRRGGSKQGGGGGAGCKSVFDVCHWLCSVAWGQGEEGKGRRGSKVGRGPRQTRGCRKFQRVEGMQGSRVESVLGMGLRPAGVATGDQEGCSLKPYDCQWLCAPAWGHN